MNGIGFGRIATVLCDFDQAGKSCGVFKVEVIAAKTLAVGGDLNFLETFGQAQVKAGLSVGDMIRAVFVAEFQVVEGLCAVIKHPRDLIGVGVCAFFEIGVGDTVSVSVDVSDQFPAKSAFESVDLGIEIECAFFVGTIIHFGAVGRFGDPVAALVVGVFLDPTITCKAALVAGAIERGMRDLDEFSACIEQIVVGVGWKALNRRALDATAYAKAPADADESRASRRTVGDAWVGGCHSAPFGNHDFDLVAHQAHVEVGLDVFADAAERTRPLR